MNQVDSSLERVRLTEQEAFANLRTVLELCAAGEVKCSDKTGRPSAATIRAIGAHLAQGDFYAEEPIAAFAWPLLLQVGGFGDHHLAVRPDQEPKFREALLKLGHVIPER